MKQKNQKKNAKAKTKNIKCARSKYKQILWQEHNKVMV